MNGDNTPNPNNLHTPQQRETSIDANHEEESTADYADYQPPGKNKSYRNKPSRNWNLKKPTITILSIAVLLGIAAAIYIVFFRSKPATAPIKQTAQPTQQQSNIATETKNYESANFSLSFDYPKDWTVKDEDGSDKLTVTSPILKLQDSSGQQARAVIILQILGKSQNFTEFDKGNAVAGLDSQKIAYTKPSPTQRANTYISFLQYSGSATSDGLDAIYITGDNGYKKGQAVPKVDISKIDPIIRVVFTDSQNKSATISASNWNKSNFSTAIKNLLQSLAIQ
jgi:hypothetical protein